jgi:glutamine amidotransferase
MGSGNVMIAIVDYKAGNLRSVERALVKLGFGCRITHDKGEILAADRVIFPGVGAAGKAMADLKALGLDEVLARVFENKTPFLGICLGAQIILDKSQEDGAGCLGLIHGEVKRFPDRLFSGKDRLKIPHMGWNRVDILKKHPVLEGITPADEFYFVHGYYPMPAARDRIIGVTEHGIGFPSVIGRGSLIAMQFHPEKSGHPGLHIIQNFCRWDGQDAE